MSDFTSYIIDLIESTTLTLVDYVSFHVLLCLIPAFFIAGAMTVFIPTDSIMRFLGPNTKKIISYPAAAIAGLLLAVCSCTVIPLFAGIYKKGAGIGPAMTFFFAAPAVNILALTYTGSLIGMDIAIARAVLALFFAILIGIIMGSLFEKNTEKAEHISLGLDKLRRQDFAIGVLILINIVSGVLMVLVEVEIFLYMLYVMGMITLLLLAKYFSKKEVVLFLWLVFILFVGTSRIEPFESNLSILTLSVYPAISNMLVKIILVTLSSILLHKFIQKNLEKEDINEWMIETKNFVKSIFPLIILGVTIAGAIKFVIPQDIIIGLVGKNTVLSNLIAVLFGVFMYFPTLMEVPIAKSFLELGMARGPLLAYLLADPELSIQSILVTRKYLGDKKNLVYVLLVTLLTTIAGLIFGLFIGEGLGFL